jgi:hypothetical protein
MGCEWYHSHLFPLCKATLGCYTAVGWGRRLEPLASRVRVSSSALAADRVYSGLYSYKGKGAAEENPKQKPKNNSDKNKYSKSTQKASFVLFFAAHFCDHKMHLLIIY